MQNKRVPIGERNESTVVNGLTLDIITTRSYTFTIDQLKYAVTADKPFGLPVSRQQALDVLCALIRKNRWELFGTFEGYRIITNGYGQFKEVQHSHGNPVKAETIFNRLATL